MGWWRFIALVIAGASLTACHTRSHDSAEGVTGGLREGVLAPLEDFNVRREAIPPILASLDVYEKPVPTSCAGIAIEIHDLEAYVGSDIDVLDMSGTASLRGQVVDMADDQAYSLVADLTTDVIPFRNLVRRATGATAHDRSIRKAYKRGRLRRSYLKGVGFAMGCDSPAAPHFPTVAAEKRRLEREAEETTFSVLEVPPAW